jgi:hypothetical protein
MASKHVPLLSLPHGWLPVAQESGSACISAEQNLKPPIVET